MRWIDFSIVVLYLGSLIWLGRWFGRKQTSTESYFVAGRSVPAWAVGMSVMASLVSSVTFIAYPGASYGGNWSLLVPGFMLLVVLMLVGRVIIPFYREAVGTSAYEYFGRRFGVPTRIYGSIAFVLGHFGKMGLVYYLVALTAHTMTGWNVDLIIITVGLVTVYFTFVGGIEAIIWTDVIQGIVTWVGVVVCLAYLLFVPPGGPTAVISLAAENGKFSFGSTAWDFSSGTVPVLILYGFFWYLQKYTADQSIVQRYLVATSDRSALKGVMYGALQTVPVWAVFMLIGTCTWSFYQLTGAAVPASITAADQMFPYFLSTQIPVGLAGLFMASLMAAATTLSSDLNSIASSGVEDVYTYIRPNASDAQRLRFGKILVATFGFLGVVMAEIIVHARGNALEMWFTISAVLSGGLAGLFVLAFLTKRANTWGIYAGITASLIFTAWATITSGANKIVDMGRANFPWDPLMIGVAGHVILMAVGYPASLLFSKRFPKETMTTITLWDWLSARRQKRTLAADLAKATATTK